MMKMKNKLFFVVWAGLVILLVGLSLRYRDRTEALVAVVESQITAISYQKPVTVIDIRVISGQEVVVGDTLVVVSRPDLILDMAKKSNELEENYSKKAMSIENKQSKIELLSIERDGKVNRLLAKKNELETKLYQDDIIRSQLQQVSKRNSGDSLSMLELNSILAEIKDVREYYRKEIQRQNLQLLQDTVRINQTIAINEKEMESLETEEHGLVKIAQFPGIVGTVEVQLGELVSPYKTLITIYELQPSLIKAFKNETISAPVRPGDSVKIVSENRSYSIIGVVKELGARITSYPTKIQPMNSEIRNYGQEIFISIPKNNHFLNGEKVYVYPNYMEEL